MIIVKYKRSDFLYLIYNLLYFMFCYNLILSWPHLGGIEANMKNLIFIIDLDIIVHQWHSSQNSSHTCR